MAEVIWGDDALDDLRRIVERISLDSPASSVRVGERIYDATARLHDFPESGPIVPEFGRNDIRELIVGVYRIIYQYRDDVCGIVIVAHSSRDLSRLIDPDHLP